jgi:flagellar biosynthesis/type III secretory pathway M-ring protein FliF/YscJ
MMQRAFTQTLPAAVGRELNGQLKTVADIEGELHESLAAAAANRGDGRLPSLARRLSAVAEQDPEQVAKLMRAWLTEGEQ